MKLRSHRIIWGITSGIVLMAVALQGTIMFLDARSETKAYEQALDMRDATIEEMRALLATDWRLRRKPTREHVEKASRYCDMLDLANAETFFARGLVQFYAHSNLEKAQVALRMSIEYKDDWAWSHDKLGVVLLELGEHEAGIKSIERAMALSPDWSRPHSDLARHYRKKEQWEKSLDHANRAIEMDKENPVPLFNYGVILDNMGKRAEAQKVYLEVLELDAELPAPYYNIACHYARNNEVEEAMNHLAIAIKYGPEFFEESKADPDFDSLREEPDFEAFMDQHRPD
jgi:tetratricopeptide (TPR) repeat protein